MSKMTIHRKKFPPPRHQNLRDIDRNLDLFTRSDLTRLVMRIEAELRGRDAMGVTR